MSPGSRPNRSGSDRAKAGRPPGLRGRERSESAPSRSTHHVLVSSLSYLAASRYFAMADVKFKHRANLRARRRARASPMWPVAETMSTALARAYGGSPDLNQQRAGARATDHRSPDLLDDRVDLREIVATPCLTMRPGPRCALSEDNFATFCSLWRSSGLRLM
jgi:hypothetical protein